MTTPTDARYDPSVKPAIYWRSIGRNPLSPDLAAVGEITITDRECPRPDRRFLWEVSYAERGMWDAPFVAVSIVEWSDVEGQWWSVSLDGYPNVFTLSPDDVDAGFSLNTLLDRAQSWLDFGGLMAALLRHLGDLRPYEVVFPLGEWTPGQSESAMEGTIHDMLVDLISEGYGPDTRASFRVLDVDFVEWWPSCQMGSLAAAVEVTP